MSSVGLGIAAVLLAAGTSSRYRAADPSLSSKLLVRLDGLPLVRHAALAALASRARPIVVVTGHAAGEVRQALCGLDLGFVHNADFAAGLSTSVKAGLAALPPDIAAAIMLLGDMPAVAASVLDGLIASFDPARDDAVVPVHAGRRGNPALLGHSLFAAARNLRGDEGARPLLARARVRELDVGDAAVTLDIDDPDSLARIRR